MMTSEICSVEPSQKKLLLRSLLIDTVMSSLLPVVSYKSITVLKIMLVSHFVFLLVQMLARSIINFELKFVVTIFSQHLESCYIL